MKDLEKIAPIPVRVDVGGERVSITPIKTRELPAMMRAVGPIMAEVQRGDIMAALTANADALINAVSIGARLDRTWVDGLDIDDLVTLAGGVVESNADFFVRRVMPILAAAIESVTRAIGSEPTAAGHE